MRHTLRQIPNGRAGTDATLKHIGDLISASQETPAVRLSALSILEKKNVNPKDQLRSISALFTWTKSQIRYVRDPIDVETIQAPEITLKLKAGDCDDHAALMASFAANLGIPARLVTVGHHHDQMSHIFAEALIGGKWIPLDTTINQPIGYRAPLPISRIYDMRGRKVMSLGTATQIFPVAKSDLQYQMYLAAYNQMLLNWNRGLINRTDVAGYLRVMDEGNSPSRGTIAHNPMRKAITDFLARIDSSGAQSSKPAGQLSGLEGMNGFLKSIWGAVKKVAGAVVKTVTGGGEKQIVINPPTINIPPGMINTNVGPDAAKAGVSELLSNPMVIGFAALAIILLMRK